MQITGEDLIRKYSELLSNATREKVWAELQLEIANQRIAQLEQEKADLYSQMPNPQAPAEGTPMSPEEYAKV